MEFVSFDLAKKLKEKGFVCDLPFAMYNELGQFALLTTSAPIRKAESGYTYRDYYDYEGFDEYDFIAPTISQVLKWLREEKKLFVEPSLFKYGYESYVQSTIFEEDKDYTDTWYVEGFYSTYERAAIAGIEYVIDNLI